MTPLPRVIRKGGFELRMLKRVGRAVIYRQHVSDGNPDCDAYEVILPQPRNTDHNGKPIAPYEGYPSAGSWGKKGWTFTSLAKALQKVQGLTQKASRRGTESRRNRFDGRRSPSERSFTAKASCHALASNDFTGKNRYTELRRHVKVPVGRVARPCLKTVTRHTNALLTTRHN
jgi:hypothetical protein